MATEDAQTNSISNVVVSQDLPVQLEILVVKSIHLHEMFKDIIHAIFPVEALFSPHMTLTSVSIDEDSHFTPDMLLHTPEMHLFNPTFENTLQQKEPASEGGTDALTVTFAGESTTIESVSTAIALDKAFNEDQTMPSMILVTRYSAPLQISYTASELNIEQNFDMQRKANPLIIMAELPTEENENPVPNEKPVIDLPPENPEEAPLLFDKKNSVEQCELFSYGKAATTGNLIDGDSIGTDIQVTHVNGISTIIDGMIIFNTLYGTLSVYATSEGKHQAGEYTYELDPTKTLPHGDNLTYLADPVHFGVINNEGISAEATLNLYINLNQAPIAEDDFSKTYIDNILIIDTENGVLANDNDPNINDTKKVYAVNNDIHAVNQVITLADGAQFQLNADGSYRYDPTTSTTLAVLKEGETAQEVIHYTMVDAQGLKSDANITIKLNGIVKISDVISPNAPQDVGNLIDKNLPAEGSTVKFAQPPTESCHTPPTACASKSLSQCVPALAVEAVVEH